MGGLRASLMAVLSVVEADCMMRDLTVHQGHVSLLPMAVLWEQGVLMLLLTFGAR